VRRAFYSRPVLEVARELIGCVVSHGGSAGVIVETEAYHDSEPASHAFVGLTARNRVLFGRPGIAYIYRSYGIHSLLNAVAEPEGIGAGVLIRALEPVAGIEAMRTRRGPSLGVRELCSGPGKLTEALGIELSMNGTDLVSRTGGPIGLSSRPRGWRDPRIVIGRRVGITKAAGLPWRFCVADNPFVSRPRPQIDAWPGSGPGLPAAPGTAASTAEPDTA
jgi:DNA-3-methyladenine glycosylase